MLMKLMTMIKSNIATEALWYADNANETDHVDEADDADEAAQGKEAVVEAFCETVWWSLWWSRLVRLSVKLFGEAVRKAVWSGCP